MRYMSPIGIIQEGQAFNLTDGLGVTNQYPPDYPKDTLPGFHPISETLCAITPNQVATESIELIDGIYTQVWSTREKTEDELIAEVKAQVPVSVTPLQGEFAIKAAYPEAYAKLKEIIASLKDDDDMKIAFTRALEWRRTSPLTLQMAALLDFDESSLDQLFIAAAKIEV
jgi:hypothetical protein